MDRDEQAAYRFQTAGAEPSLLVDDRWIATQLRVSPTTIRVQRHRRRRGELHWFHVDPVLVGTAPRYLREEVMAWFRDFARRKATTPADSKDEANRWPGVEL